MIYVAIQTPKAGNPLAYFAKNKKDLQTMGFNWISRFENETKAVMWVNENYMLNTKEFLYD